MDIDSVADELYSLPPEEFTATRNAREKEARAIGDKKLAAGIHQLRKPSATAWLANQLVREHRDEIQPLLDLGVGLREATAMLDGNQLRELGKQRHQLVYVLLQRVRALADAAGHAVTQSTARGLEDTLHAALVDGGAADQLRAGRLTDTLQRSGFPPTEGIPAANSAPVPKSPGAAKTESAGRLRSTQLGRVERDQQLARVVMQDAAAELEHAQAVANRAETSVQKASKLVDRLRAQLDRAESEQSRREQEQRRSQVDVDRASRVARVAARRLDAAVQQRQPDDDS